MAARTDDISAASPAWVPVPCIYKAALSVRNRDSRVQEEYLNIVDVDWSSVRLSKNALEQRKLITFVRPSN